jgi:hypothetical protein
MARVKRKESPLEGLIRMWRSYPGAYESMTNKEAARAVERAMRKEREAGKGKG